MTIKIKDTISGSITGNAGTATTLQTTRTINGTNFNGSENITTASWGTARTLTVGNKAQSVNGSTNITWSLSDIGAAPASHGTHLTLGTSASNAYYGDKGKIAYDHSQSAHNSLATKGTNTIGTSDDTTASWGAHGLSAHWYTDAGTLTDKPSAWGYLLNVGQNAEVHQLWMTQSSGTIYHRGGNASGWNGSWKAMLDSANFGSYAVPVSGGTMSGRLTANGGITIQCPGSSWVTGKHNLANLPITSSTQITEGSYHPMIGAKLFNGDVVNLGGICNSFGFYGYAANRTENGLDWQFSFDSGNRNVYTDMSFSCDSNISTNRYININAWPGYGSGTASFWYNANSSYVQCNAGLLTDRALDAGWHCNFRDGFNIPSRGDRYGVLFNTYGSGGNSYLEIARRNSADTDWDWGNSIKMYPYEVKVPNLQCYAGGGCFKLYAGNAGHTWMAFHIKDGSRGAWMGYGSDGSTAFTISADGGNGRVHIQNPTLDGIPFTISSYAPGCGGVWVQI